MAALTNKSVSAQHVLDVSDGICFKLCFPLLADSAVWGNISHYCCTGVPCLTLTHVQCYDSLARA